MLLIGKLSNPVNSVSCVINAKTLHPTSLRSFAYPVSLTMQFPDRPSSATNITKVSWRWWYKHIRHHWQLSKRNAKGSQKSLLVKYRRDIKLNILPCYAILPAKFQDKGMKRFDWILEFSSSYWIRSSERKQPRRFHCFKTRTVSDPVAFPRRLVSCGAV